MRTLTWSYKCTHCIHYTLWQKLPNIIVIHYGRSSQTGSGLSQGSPVIVPLRARVIATMDFHDHTASGKQNIFFIITRGSTGPLGGAESPQSPTLGFPVPYICSKMWLQPTSGFVPTLFARTYSGLNSTREFGN